MGKMGRLLALCAGAVLLLAISPVRASVLYQIENADPSGYSGFNCSDVSETRDCWVGNPFTVQAGGETITKVIFFQYSGDATSYAGKLGIYLDNGDATAPQAATLVYQQDFSATVAGMNEFTLTTPVTLAAGDKMIVAIMLPNIGPADFPYVFTGDTTLGRSYWDRDFSIAKGDPVDNPMTIGDLSKAVPTDQALIPGGWNPSANSCNTIVIRAEGVPEPATMSLLTIGGLAALIRRRK